MKRFHMRVRGEGGGRRSRGPSSRAAALAACAALAMGATAILAPNAPAAHATGLTATPRVTPLGTTEKLDHAPVSVHTSKGNLVSWRWLATDADDVAFNVFRADTATAAPAKLTSAPLTGGTDFFDAGAPADADYTIQPVVNGVAAAPAEHAIPMADGYLDVPIQPPSGSYTANDASVGDLDGDGDLDFVLKWDPTNSKDNSQAGVTDDTIVDGYTLEGQRLWRIDLGRNIRSGAHYTQFQVFDYDGDGKAEVAMKTADGTKDGTGKVIGNANADYRNSDGYILTGPEYLTMFNGQTGAAMDTVDYVPPRGTVSSWGDSYGNRVDRFLAATAYVDGSHPSLIEARGYYTRTVISAWDFKGGKFARRWTFDTNSSTNVGKGYDGQGNHNLSVADVDGDGKDEIVYGAMAVDDNGYGLWTTRNGHGDAMHVGDLDPSRSGLEEFKVDEDSSKPSSWMADARTGQILWSTPANGDNGRGVSDDIWSGSPGAESWSSHVDGLLNTKGQNVGRKPSSINFLAWWDGDTTRELLDDTHIDKYGTGSDTRLLTGSGVHSNNGTKATPSLSGDIMGDWREEVVWPTTDNKALRIYSTPYTTDTRITTLLQDRQYREALAWQNTAYNQPPHPSYFIGSGMSLAPRPAVTTKD